MVFCSPWVTSLYCSPVVGSVKVLYYCKILYLIKKPLENENLQSKIFFNIFFQGIKCFVVVMNYIIFCWRSSPMRSGTIRIRLADAVYIKDRNPILAHNINRVSIV